MKPQQIENKVADFWNRESRDWGDKYGVRSSYYFRCQIFYNFFTESAAGKKCQILDYGCGAGDITFPFLSEGHSVLGVDIAAEMVSKAKDRAKGNGFSANSEYRVLKDESLLQISQQEFDVVVCSSVIEYAADDHALLELFGSVLKPNGTLIISIPDQKSVFCKLDKWLFKNQNLVNRFIPVGKLAYLDIQKRQYNVNQFIKSVEEVGFCFQKMKYNSITKQRGYLMEKISNIPGCGMLCILKFSKR